jgi:hypothetical protein
MRYTPKPPTPKQEKPRPRLGDKTEWRIKYAWFPIITDSGTWVWRENFAVRSVYASCKHEYMGFELNDTQWYKERRLLEEMYDEQTNTR